MASPPLRRPPARRPDPRAHQDVRRVPGSGADAAIQRGRRQHRGAWDEIWITDFNGDNLWRYDIGAGQFTQFAVPEPSDVAVDAAGIVWFTVPIATAIGRLDPQTGAVSLTSTTGFPRQITVAADGKIWFTERFTPQAVGRLDPATNVVTEFPVTPGVGPEGIAASPDGAGWFTQTTKGNIARIADDGVITEGKAVKGS